MTNEELVSALGQREQEIASLRGQVEAMNAIANTTAQQVHEQQAAQWNAPDDYEEQIVAATPPPRPVAPPPTHAPGDSEAWNAIRAARLPRPTVDRELAVHSVNLAKSLEARVPEWRGLSETVIERASASPALAQAFSRNDPSAVAGIVGSLFANAKASADTRMMKMQAQTAVGAGGRLEAGSDDQVEWAKIKAAQPKRYYE
jgi:hypothetical protein